MSACKHRVSGSLSLPSRGSFHLSLTVLYSIGHQVVFSLRRWSSCLHAGFLVSCTTLGSCLQLHISSTRLLLCIVRFSNPCSTILHCHLCKPVTPSKHLCSKGLGSFPFARHYLGNRSFSFFSSGYLDVSVPRVPFVATIYSSRDLNQLLMRRSRIRKSAARCSFAANRGLSQLITSFFGAWCQGIHHMLFVAWSI